MKKRKKRTKEGKNIMSSIQNNNNSNNINTTCCDEGGVQQHVRCVPFHDEPIIVTNNNDYILLSDNDDDGDCDGDVDGNVIIIEQEEEVENYELDPQRFAVLLVFSLNNLLASAVWITFAPIEDAVCHKFDTTHENIMNGTDSTASTGGGGITTNQVNWLSMIFMALYGPGTAICSWSIRNWGLSRVVTISSLVMTIGCVFRWWSIYLLQMRVIPTNSTTTNNNTSSTVHWNGPYTILLLGQGLVAMGQPVFSNAPARLAAIWFPSTSCAQALGVTVFAGMVGMVLGQGMSPFWVDEQTGNGLGQVLGVQAISMIICMISTFYYFDSEPKYPPSRAEAIRRRQQQQHQQQRHNISSSASSTFVSTASSSNSIWNDIWTLSTDRQYIILLIAFGLGYGVNNAILTLLQPWVAIAGGFPGDKIAGLCGSLSIFGGVLGTLIVGPILDSFPSNSYKQIIPWSFFVAFLSSIAVVATLQPTCPIWLLLTSFFIMGMTTLPLLTICLDAAAAHSYPIPEELSSSGLQLVGQYLGIIMIHGMEQLLLNNNSNDDDDDQNHHSAQQGFTAPVNIALLIIVAISTAVAFCYNGDDSRARANHCPSSSIVGTTTTNPLLFESTHVSDVNNDDDDEIDEEDEEGEEHPQEEQVGIIQVCADTTITTNSNDNNEIILDSYDDDKQQEGV